MKLKHILTPILVSLSLSSCVAPTGNYDFNANLISPQIYNKYWAMEPQNDVANVFIISPNGSATLYRYSCDALNNYKTKNKGTIGQIIEQLAMKADDKAQGSGELVREFVKVERYKIETLAQNEIKLHAIVLGGWSSLKFTDINKNNLSATQTFFGGLGGTKSFQYTNVNSPSFPICKNTSL